MIKKLTITLIFLFSFALTNFVPAYACSCIPEGAYFENNIDSNSFVAVVEIEGISANTRESDGITYQESTVNFTLSERYYGSAVIEQFEQSYITDHPIRQCSPQCDKYLQGIVGANSELTIENNYFIVLNETDQGYNLFAAIPVDEDKINNDFLQFSKGTSTSEIVDYILQVLGEEGENTVVPDTDTDTDVDTYTSSDSSNTTMFLITGFATLLIIVGAVFFWMKKKQKNS